MGSTASHSLEDGSACSRDSRRPETLQLTYEQAVDLLKVLDNTRYVLETFVGQVQNGRDDRRPQHSWWATHCWPACRRNIARFILLITVVLQIVNLVVVTLIDVWPRSGDGSVVIVTVMTMLLLQALNLFFIGMVSLRLLRQLTKHRVSMLLMIQSYAATLLLFAGIYTLTYRMQPKSWKFIEQGLENDPSLVVELYVKFLYFSVSTGTLCGSDNVLPKEWYNCIFTATQMLMSFVYFASILGQTLSHDTQYWLGVGPDHERSEAEGSNPYVTNSNTVAGNSARVSGISSHIWRNYGSAATTPALSESALGNHVGGGGGGGGGENSMEDGYRRQRNVSLPNMA